MSNVYSQHIRRVDITTPTEPLKVRGFENVSPESILKIKSFIPPKDLRVFVSDKMYLPKAGSLHSAGYDLFSPLDVCIPSQQTVLVWSNVKAYMQPNEMVIAVVRSSVGTYSDLMIASTLGVIDADYYNNPNNEGNICIALRNLGTKDVFIKEGDRPCQLIFLPHLKADNCNSDAPRVSGLGST